MTFLAAEGSTAFGMKKIRVFSTSALQTSDWKLFYSAMIHSRPYRDLFSGKSIPDDSRQARALAVALDVRKFEIELYWKRAAYFWAFTGAALAGHLKEMSEQPPNPEILLLTSSVGLVFAVAWYFVNRGSKYWQKNWETHVDLLEDTVLGPLYKTITDDRNLSFREPNGPYPFSVSKINQLLSLFSVVMFALCMANTLFDYYWPNFVKFPDYFECLKDYACYAFPVIVIVFTAAALILLWFFGKSSNKERNKIKESPGYPFTEVEIHEKPHV